MNERFRFSSVRICTVNKSGFSNYYKKSFFFYNFSYRIGSGEVSLKKVDLTPLDAWLQRASPLGSILGDFFISSESNSSDRRESEAFGL